MVLKKRTGKVFAKQDPRVRNNVAVKNFYKKYLRSSVSTDRMPACQSLVVATYPEWKGGY